MLWGVVQDAAGSFECAQGAAFVMELGLGTKSCGGESRSALRKLMAGDTWV